MFIAIKRKAQNLTMHYGGSMLELAQEYGGDLLYFMIKYGKLKKKDFR
jgi:hypothetical protein